MTVNAALSNLEVYMLVFARIGGMVLFNPLLSRRNLPGQVKVALILGITVLLTPMVGGALTEGMSTGALMLAMMQELMVGIACGFIFQIFYFLLFTAGDVIDMGFGLSMAKAFDPGTNLQISMSGNLFQLLFVLYLFTTDCHLLLIKIMAASYDLVGPGAVVFGAEAARFVIEVFTTAFSMAMRLALPFVAAAFVLEFSMGILMKLIPQINVFTIHFQFKIIFGFILLFLFATPVNAFMQNYVDVMFVNMQNLFGVL